MSDQTETICGVEEQSCVCIKEPHDDGPHVCECGGSWEIIGGEFHIRALPGSAEGWEPRGLPFPFIGPSMEVFLVRPAHRSRPRRSFPFFLLGPDEDDFDEEICEVDGCDELAVVDMTECGLHAEQSRDLERADMEYQRMKDGD